MTSAVATEHPTWPCSARWHGAQDVSDLDLLVDLDSDRSLLDHIGLQQELEDLLGVRVDVVTRRGLHPILRDSVLADAVPV